MCRTTMDIRCNILLLNERMHFMSIFNSSWIYMIMIIFIIIRLEVCFKFLIYSQFVFWFLNLAPYNSAIIYSFTSSETSSKIVDYVHNKLRGAFELTHLFENYSLSLSGQLKIN